MKKLVSVFALITATVSGASAAPSYITRDGRGGYNVTYDYTDKAKTGWYVGGHLGLSLLNFKNEYSSDWTGVDADFGDDKYSFEPVFTGSLVAGKRINYFWRAELEAGYIGQFSDKDNGFEYTLSAPYVMANGYYDFTNGLYAGAGVGMAIPMTKLDGDDFLSGDREKTSVSPMLGLMLGYSYKLDYNMVLDVRYRLAGFWGHEQKRNFEVIDNDTGEVSRKYFKNDNGLILDNSITLGLRYEF